MSLRNPIKRHLPKPKRLSINVFSRALYGIIQGSFFCLCLQGMATFCNPKIFSNRCMEQRKGFSQKYFAQKPSFPVSSVHSFCKNHQKPLKTLYLAQKLWYNILECNRISFTGNFLPFPLLYILQQRFRVL